MIREIIVEADTTDKAIQLGCEKLGISIDEASVEVLEFPTPKKFGLFGGSLAKVRVYVETEDPVVPEVREEVKEVVKEAPKPVPKAEAPKKEEPVEVIVEEPEEEAPAEEEEETAEPMDISQCSETCQTAYNYLRMILDGMGLEKAQINVTEKEESAVYELVGEGLGTAIGRRGENLTAMQYLVSLAANNSRENYYRVSINIGNYREKREQALEKLANKVAARALKINRNLSLEPMNPYERRIVHTIVHDIEGVNSWSVGEDAKRHVVIGPIGLDEGADGAVFNPNGGRGGNRGGYNRGGYNRNNRGGYNRNGGRGGYNRGGNRGGYNRNGGYNKSSYAAPANTAPKSDYSGSLYGKIEVPKKNED